MEFKAGDVVELKSGGPAMTVDAIEDEVCSCSWFNGSELKRGDFSPHALKLYKPHGQASVEYGM